MAIASRPSALRQSGKCGQHLAGLECWPSWSLAREVDRKTGKSTQLAPIAREQHEQQSLSCSEQHTFYTQSWWAKIIIVPKLGLLFPPPKVKAKLGREEPAGEDTHGGKLNRLEMENGEWAELGWHAPKGEENCEQLACLLLQ